MILETSPPTAFWNSTTFAFSTNGRNWQAWKHYKWPYSHHHKPVEIAQAWHSNVPAPVLHSHVATTSPGLTCDAICFLLHWYTDRQSSAHHWRNHQTEPPRSRDAPGWPVNIHIQNQALQIQRAVNCRS